MDNREVKSIIESLLFTWGDPLDIKDISNILEFNQKEVESILEEMINDFNYNRRGLKILKIKNTYQLGTRAEHFEWIRKLSTPKKKSLSAAAVETLSIIAYKQPIIKSDIETIRGVRCDKAIDTLMNLELITELGRLEKTGRPILYGTTNEFLRHFGLESLKDLPPLLDIEEEIEES